jgi:two-component system, OmpR family, response regulator
MRILLVQDDLDYLSDHIAEIEKEYIVDVAYTASDGCYMSEVNDYDVIVVDSYLPDNDGHYFCKVIREANVASPILYLSNKENSVDRASCLKDGANVCLSKAASTQELSAQIKALVRLRHKYAGSNSIKLADGMLSIDLSSQIVKHNNLEIPLRKKEFGILEYLLLNRGRIVSKEELLDHIWEDGILVKSNSLEVHVRNIRQKLEKPFCLNVINTIRGFGYKIN